MFAKTLVLLLSDGIFDALIFVNVTFFRQCDQAQSSTPFHRYRQAQPSHHYTSVIKPSHPHPSTGIDKPNHHTTTLV